MVTVIVVVALGIGIAALLWWAAASRGEAIAMFDLGGVFERGIGTAVDMRQARAWFWPIRSASDAVPQTS